MQRLLHLGLMGPIDTAKRTSSSLVHFVIFSLQVGRNGGKNSAGELDFFERYLQILRPLAVVVSRQINAIQRMETEKCRHLS